VRFAAGATIVLREVLGGRVRSARPLRVVADEPDHFVGYLVPRSAVAWPRLADGIAQSQTPDQGWRLCRETWQGPGSLFVVPAGAGFAAVRFLDPTSGEPRGWKVDFLRPLARHRLGFDTLDHAFDLLASPDLSDWAAKDLDDLGQLIRLGLLAGDERSRFDRERERVETWLTAAARAAADPTGQPDPTGQTGQAGPFGPPWAAWRPDPTWPPLDLPDGWDDVTIGPAGSADPDGGAGSAGPAVTGPGSRSAGGIRVLDGDGIVHLDLDLAGGSLWLGHAPPAVVEALTRQLPLGWHHGEDHPAFGALRSLLLDDAPAGWDLCWTTGRHGTDLDAVLVRTGWPFPGPDGLAGLVTGTGTGTFGARLFAGFDRRLVIGPADRLPPPARRVPGDVLAALAALETLRTATAGAVAATAARAERLRRRSGLQGTGGELVGPPGWSAPGVLVPADGRGLLALCADDDDVDELARRLDHRRAAPEVTGR
jgi:hypothetical protein